MEPDDTEFALRRTPLEAVHEACGARMVPFAGWRMPLQYEGIIAEHMAVRSRAGVFDVSHMGELRVAGEPAIEAAQRVLSNDLSRISQPGAAQYTMLLNERGGIEDDLIAYRVAPDELLLVVNAANREHDAALLQGIARDESDQWAMLALQGPQALEVLGRHGGGDLAALGPFSFVHLTLAGHRCMVAMTGYTGESGCELLMPADGAVDVWMLLTSGGDVTPCGLGARDTLRLEACFPLHGNDIGPDVDPISAGLGFAAPASVAGGGAAHGSLDGIRERGPQRRLVPILVDGRGIPRNGVEVLVEGEQVGVVSSGTMSPVLRAGIALGWVDSDHAALGTRVELDVRGSRVAADIVRRPFVAGRR